MFLQPTKMSHSDREKYIQKSENIVLDERHAEIICGKFEGTEENRKSIKAFSIKRR